MSEQVEESTSTERTESHAEKTQQPPAPDAANSAGAVQERADELLTLAEDLVDHAGQLTVECDEKELVDLAERIGKIKRAVRRAIRWADKLDMCVALANRDSKTSGKFNPDRPAHRGRKRSKSAGPVD